MGRLSGKTAIITGAARGMGAVTARLFVNEGAKVALGDVLDGTALAQELGENALFCQHDVTSEAAWADLIGQANARFGPVDILVNNAGMVHFTAIEELDPDEARRVIDVNTIGAMIGAKHVVPQMVEAGKGVIINISSVDGLRGCNGLSVYTASKWALRGLTKSLAMELAPRGIRVVSVHPGGVDTPMGNARGLTGDERNTTFKRVPMQRIGEPEEIARTTLFLASDDASYITGAEIAVDGGWTAGILLNVLPGAPEGLGA
ncbi:glucose 1-dehydrogenase [Croceicoccus sp. F390]|uniref:Glucose 1-dehydrogenase n=1 Tax=Croceicoccus esteveae TaxID=3075597 RepID=A0ABU2ZF21_9SPHN|nr:glucose 1-dehydrogenase [Croceicoccus sp. F390]MDT0575188.1 glucose 1-dehydrogenase [Croceicoccus sp. F390]